jgi:hypothetical protein
MTDEEKKWVKISSSKATPVKNTQRKEVFIAPSSEMHILIGGPYVLRGKEHRYGHTALRVKTSFFDVTYDFGRYGAVSGLFGEKGEGILQVWSAFQPYITNEISLNRLTKGFVYNLTDQQAEKVKAYFDALQKNAILIKEKSTSVKTVYKLNQDYHALGPNCTTLSIDGAKQAIPDIDDGSMKFYKPDDVLDWKEITALSVSGGGFRVFLPANLERFLERGNKKHIRIDRYEKTK